MCEAVVHRVTIIVKIHLPFPKYLSVAIKCNCFPRPAMVS